VVANWAPRPGTVSGSVALLGQNGIVPSTTVALAQSSSSPPSPFSIDSFGRLSLSQPGTVSLSATFSLDRSITNGAAGGIAALRLPDASVPLLTAPSVLTAGFVDDNNAHATAALTYSAQVPANVSCEVNYYNGSQFIEDVLGGSLTVTLVPASTVDVVEVVDAHSRAFLTAGGSHWIDVIPLPGSLIVEAGCPHGWAGHRETLGAGKTAQPLVEDLVAEHDRVSGCVVRGVHGRVWPRGLYTWRVVGSRARLEQLSNQGVLAA
jgi:hypothetical protein